MPDPENENQDSDTQLPPKNEVDRDFGRKDQPLREDRQDQRRDKAERPIRDSNRSPERSKREKK